jgi:hypothetical protein
MSDTYTFTQGALTFIILLTLTTGGLLGFLLFGGRKTKKGRVDTRDAILAAHHIADEVTRTYYPCTDMKVTEAEVNHYWQERVFHYLRGGKVDA